MHDRTCNEKYLPSPMEGDGRVMKITCLKKEKNLEADTLKSKERNELSFFSDTVKITTEDKEITPP